MDKKALGLIQQLTAQRDFYKRQLDAVDAMLPPWECSPERPGSAIGRVNTIRNLLVDREQGRVDKARITMAIRLLEAALKGGK